MEGYGASIYRTAGERSAGNGIINDGYEANGFRPALYIK